jgi:hypothetical protein
MGHRAALGPDVVDRVLDDVERRRFLVEPAREDALPAPLRASNAKLDEGAGQLLHLPGGGGLAGPQAHRRIADPHRLAGLQGEVAGNAVALVEEAQHGDALGHRRGAGGDRGHGLRNVDGPRLAGRLTPGSGIVLGIAVATGQSGESDQDGAEREPHARSGVQAS